MDAAKFHRDLLGIDQECTPEPFRLSSEASRLYAAYAQKDVRGFGLDGPPTTPGHQDMFLATFVLGLMLSGGGHPVVLAVPRPYTDWALGQTKKIARHVFRERRGNTAAIVALRKAFQQVDIAQRVLQIPEPERWVAFGFNEAIPEWMKERLL